VWPQDPGFGTALAGGVTSMLILPGSGNLIGGRGVVLKSVPGETYQQMKFPGAPWSLKMACGENPKRFYGGRGSAPMTRMGNVAGYRNALLALGVVPVPEFSAYWSSTCPVSLYSPIQVRIVS
jgi:imidazolonepropionase-like amidohydrolase